MKLRPKKHQRDGTCDDPRAIGDRENDQGSWIDRALPRGGDQGRGINEKSDGHDVQQQRRPEAEQRI